MGFQQILRQEHKVSHEHKEILEIIAQGSTAVASSLRMLLQWGETSYGSSILPYDSMWNIVFLIT